MNIKHHDRTSFIQRQRGVSFWEFAFVRYDSVRLQERFFVAEDSSDTNLFHQRIGHLNERKIRIDFYGFHKDDEKR